MIAGPDRLLGATCLGLGAGTLVATTGGPIAVERVEARQRVLTRLGEGRVLATATVAGDAVRLRCSDGRLLVGSADDEAWTSARGWQRLAALVADDVLLRSDGARVHVASVDAVPGARVLFCLLVDAEYFGCGVLLR